MWDLRRGDLVGRAYRRAVPRGLRHHIEFIQKHGRPAYLPWSKPTSFMGKVVWRIHNDRRDLIRPLGDKLAMKDIAAAAGVATPETLWSGTDPDELAEASVSFGRPWVLKPNHASQTVRFYDGPISAEEAQRVAGPWVHPEMVFGTAHGEWAYSQARKLIVAEEALGPEGVDLPDFRMFTFDGKPVVCGVDSGKFGPSRSYSFFRLPDWELMDVTGLAPPRDMPAPPELPLMLDAASRVGAPYDFVRVDLYARGGQVWLGELTPYPGIGLVRYEPQSFDDWLGSQWKLPEV